MAERQKGPRGRRHGDSEADVAAAEWADFAREEEQELRVRRWSIGIALALHLGFAVVFGLVGALPTIGYEVEREKPVFVVRPARFQPPPPRQEEMPKPRAMKIPIPDPTPDDPEPIVNPEEIDLEMDLSDTDITFGPPEAPPIVPQGPIHMNAEVKAPVKISGPDPVYTDSGRRAGIEGVVIVQAIVSKHGMVESVQVLKGLPLGLDQAAVEAVRRWRFAPATLHGRPVDVYYTLTVNFQLN